METDAVAFAALRPQLFAIAYRMLGSVVDAEDLVQEAYLRWQEAPDTEVRSPGGYLTTIVTRLAINQLRSARAQREVYVGPWLPEPLVTTAPSDSPDAVELAESLSMAFLVLLERLSPIERAVFLLHDVFDFDYGEIARVVDKTAANSRQILTRARKHLGSSRRRFETEPVQADRLVHRFVEAAQAGDLDGLLGVLAEDITLWADGGGKVPGAALKPVHGATAVGRFAIGVVRRFVPTDRVIRPARLNGQSAFIVYAAGEAMAALVFDIRGSRIHEIYAIGNPDKLQALPTLV